MNLSVSPSTKSQDPEIASVEAIIEDMKMGRPVIIIDDENRENEGDIIVAAEHATPENINFMARFARGLICLAMAPDLVDKLSLSLMGTPEDLYKTAFTMSIDARENITTGISAFDRSHTIQLAIKDDITAKDFVTPGHIFPLRAKEKGVLDRNGHTEAGVDFARLAGLTPAAAICEVMNDDGHMARLPDLQKFAAKHNLKIGTIADLVRYRRENHV